MDTVLLVSPTQVEGWHYPMVRRLVRIAQKKASLHHLKRALELIVLKGEFWKPFLPLPFTADSVEGRRISEAWEDVKKKYPHSTIVREFFWRFWHPEADMRDATLVGDSFGQAPTLASLARQEAGVRI